MSSEHRERLECVLLASLLRYPDCVPGAAEVVWPADFSSPERVAVASMIAEAPLSLLDLEDELVQAGMEPEKAGVVVGTLSDPVGDPAEVMGLAVRVREYAERDWLIREAARIAAHGGTAAEIRRDMAHAAEWSERQAQDETETTATVRERYADEAEEALAHGHRLSITTGIPWFDNLRPMPGQFVLLGARSKTGKTWLGQEIIESAARQGVRCAWFSTEMDWQDLAPRLFVHDGVRWMGDRVPESVQDVADLREATGRVGASPFFKYAVDAEEIFRRMDRLVRTQGVEFLLVDYLQDIHVPHDWARDEITKQKELGRRLKAFAKRNRVFVLAVSSTRKASDPSQENKAPTPSDFYGGGSLVFQSDMVITLHRPKPHQSNLVEVNIPLARAVRDSARTWLYRRESDLRYEQISYREMEAY